MQRIDLKAILQRTVSGVYGDLVTRPTGQAVRSGIEHMLDDLEREQIAVIDFSTVRCLDISCADEIVGKLLLEHGRNFLLYGVTASHCEAIEQVLEQHRMAVVARDRDGRVQLLGPVADTARQVFGVLSEAGPAAPGEIAEHLAVSMDAAHEALDELLAQHLVQQSADQYVALTVP